MRLPTKAAIGAVATLPLGVAYALGAGVPLWPSLGVPLIVVTPFLLMMRIMERAEVEQARRLIEYGVEDEPRCTCIDWPQKFCRACGK